MTSAAIKELIDSHLKNLHTTNPEIERRIAILEAKCKNIDVDEDVNVPSESLTIEERLAILELKCANMV